MRTDVKKADLDAIVKKFDDGPLVLEHDCCGCGKPWDLYYELIAAIKALSESAATVDPTPIPQESNAMANHFPPVPPHTTYSKAGAASVVVLCTDDDIEEAIEELDAAVAAVKVALDQRIEKRDAK